MYLTEEQIKLREEKFINLMEIISEELYESKNEIHELSEEDYYIASIMMEHFVENYRDVSLQEAALIVRTGHDPNEELIKEFIDLCLDESIGGFVAGAVHGISNFLAKRRAEKAKQSVTTARNVAGKAFSKSMQAKKSAKGASGLTGTFRKAKAATLQSRHDAAKQAVQSAKSAEKSTAKNYAAGLKKRQQLKTKIDTGVANVKNKIIGGIKTGAHRVAAAAGRVAGTFA